MDYGIGQIGHGLGPRSFGGPRAYFEETTTEIVMSPRQNFKTTTFYSILDSLTTELMKRKEVYCKLQNKFGFLFQITNLSHLELREAASNLQKHFWKDLEYAFVEELISSLDI